ncbi:MAG: hypothetical protein ACRYFX_28735 [Janthinobacterium lividum]
MPESPETTALQTAAEQVRQQLQLPAYDAAAVTQLAHLIEAQRDALNPAEREGFVTGLGCFLGECLVRSYHAEWAAGRDGSTGVGLVGRLFFNPFYLVNQQLEKGLAASVATFFASVPERLAAAGRGRKHWIS